MYLFSKKINCLNCNQNFRGVNERGKRKYICSGYHNYRSCVRWKVEEEWLVELIHNHFIIDMYKDMRITGGKGSSKDDTEKVVPEELIDRVESIKVSPVNEELTIYFKDGTKTFMSKDRQTYWTE